MDPILTAWVYTMSFFWLVWLIPSSARPGTCITVVVPDFTFLGWNVMSSFYTRKYLRCCKFCMERNHVTSVISRWASLEMISLLVGEISSSNVTFWSRLFLQVETACKSDSIDTIHIAMQSTRNETSLIVDQEVTCQDVAKYYTASSRYDLQLQITCLWQSNATMLTSVGHIPYIIL
jgi:hypothetical protein